MIECAFKGQAALQLARHIVWRFELLTGKMITEYLHGSKFMRTHSVCFSQTRCI